MAKLPGGFDYRKYPVLIVDDDEAFLKAFVNEFSDDFTVFSAPDAETGLKIVNEQQNLAVILADQRMPGVTGVELLEKVKSRHPDITRLLITAYADIKAAIDAINIGDIFKYISKPYKYDEVKQIIQRGIERYYFSLESKRLQKEEISHLRREVDSESIAALNALTYGFSHHFNNKLSAAVTFFSILPDKLKELIQNARSDIDKEYWHNYSKIAEEGIKNVIELISDLYAFANIGGYSFEQADIVRFLDSEKVVFESLAQGKRIDFQYSLPKQLPLVSLDILRMSQAFENIVLNAIQAIPKKGTVKISAEKVKDVLKITVADNGAGIEEENLKKIFYPFFTTKDPKTKGLGLSIADAIIRQHSGKIELQSKPQQGTTIAISLPLKG